MNTYPSKTTQNGRTEFWETLRDKKLDEYATTVQEARLWRPIDYLMRQRTLRRLEQFIVKATTIIGESKEADLLLVEDDMPIELSASISSPVPVSDIAELAN